MLSLRPALSPRAAFGAARVLPGEGSGMPLLGPWRSRVLASGGTLLGKQRWTWLSYLSHPLLIFRNLLLLPRDLQL